MQEGEREKLMLRSVLLLGGTLLFISSASADETVIYNLPAGSQPSASLLNNHGTLYGVSSTGGSLGDAGGFVFKVTQAPGGKWRGRRIILFNGNTEYHWPMTPAAPLMMDDATGMLYGTSSAGGSSNLGTIFSPTPRGSWDILHSFTGGKDGAYPVGKLVMDRTTGTIYGTTSQGGDYGCGTIFQLSPSEGSWVLVPLANAVGCEPLTGLEPGSSPGTYFGTAKYEQQDGHPRRRQPHDRGIVYEFALSGGSPTERVIEDFPHPRQGELPADLAVVSDDRMFGVATDGGRFNSGVVFELDLSKQKRNPESVLYAFAGGADGAHPAGLHYEQSSGTIYGTTSAGGTNGAGTLFKLTHMGKEWTETVLHSFGAAGDGVTPVGRPVEDQATGVLYGVTKSGGQSNGGVVYSYSP
jgi:uncharacterized repeat protein (TIGR03803 family)